MSQTNPNFDGAEDLIKRQHALIEEISEEVGTETRLRPRKFKAAGWAETMGMGSREKDAADGEDVEDLDEVEALWELLEETAETLEAVAEELGVSEGKLRQAGTGKFSKAWTSTMGLGTPESTETEKSHAEQNAEAIDEIRAMLGSGTDADVPAPDRKFSKAWTSTMGMAAPREKEAADGEDIDYEALWALLDDLRAMLAGESTDANVDVLHEELDETFGVTSPENGGD